MGKGFAGNNGNLLYEVCIYTGPLFVIVNWGPPRRGENRVLEDGSIAEASRVAWVNFGKS